MSRKQVLLTSTPIIRSRFSAISFFRVILSASGVPTGVVFRVSSIRNVLARLFLFAQFSSKIANMRSVDLFMS